MRASEKLENFTISKMPPEVAKRQHTSDVHDDDEVPQPIKPKSTTKGNIEEGIHEDPIGDHSAKEPSKLYVLETSFPTFEIAKFLL